MTTRIGIHPEGHQRGPLQQEPGHDQNEADVLRMAHAGVGARGGESVRALRLVQHLPGRSQQPESGNDKHVARQMERPQVRIGLPAEQHLQEVSGIMGKEIDAGKRLESQPDRR